MSSSDPPTSNPNTSSPPIVDIHTHIYPPSYIRLLQSRTTIPYIRSVGSNSTTTTPSSASTSTQTHRLIILPSEASSASTSSGRPIGPAYSSLAHKLAFMNTHSISASVLSLANPWLDFLPASDSPSIATALNNEINDLCGLHPSRFFFFAALPTTAPVPAIIAEISRLATTLSSVRGVILGTTGLGSGLDDPALIPVFHALAAAELPIFLHPHYGLPDAVWGPRAAEYGHVLPLALGFPLETTIAVTRMVLAGVFDEVEGLRVIVAHSGGALPFLAGRLESCVEHDGFLQNGEREKERHGGRGASEDESGKRRTRKTIWEVLKENIYLDAVIYSETGLRAAVQACGSDRVMFGTDHPFFPPLGEEGEEGKWRSVETNYEAVKEALGSGTKEEKAVLGGNAVRILKLTV